MPRPLSVPASALLACTLALGVFALDLASPRDVAVGSLYVVAVLLAFRLPSTGVLAVAFGATVLIVAGYLASPPESQAPVALANRTLSALAVWTTAILVVLYRRTETALRARSQEVQQYLDVAGVMFVVLDLDGRIRMINQTGCELLGYGSPAELLGRDWARTCVPPAWRDAVGRVRRAVIAEPRTTTQVNPVLTRTGEERVVLWHNVALSGLDGLATGTLSSGADITEQEGLRRDLERSLRELESFKFALDQAAIVSTTDAEGRITSVNEQFCRISGYTPEELLGQTHRLVNSGYHAPEFFVDLWETISAGRIWRGEIRNRAKTGTLYWVETTIVPFLDARGTPVQYVEILNDVSERKRSEQRLRDQAALARLGEMAAVVAHEVKNPIAGIQGALQIIRGRMSGAQPERQVIADILGRLEGLNQTVEDVLQYARPQPPRFATADLGPLIETSLLFVTRSPAGGGVEIERAIEPMQVRADGQLLMAVFTNLLLNAAQAVQGKGRIRVDATSHDGSCLVTIADSGPGIPPDVRDRVFEPFFTTKSRGTGLGLPLARRVVEAHGGDIDVSCPDGGGTIVSVRLPLGGTAG